MKKALTLFLTLVLVFSFCACGAEDQGPTEPSTTVPEATEAPAESTQAPAADTEAPAETTPAPEETTGAASVPVNPEEFDRLFKGGVAAYQTQMAKAASADKSTTPMTVRSVTEGQVFTSIAGEADTNESTRTEVVLKADGKGNLSLDVDDDGSKYSLTYADAYLYIWDDYGDPKGIKGKPGEDNYIFNAISDYISVDDTTETASGLMQDAKMAETFDTIVMETLPNGNLHLTVKGIKADYLTKAMSTAGEAVEDLELLVNMIDLSSVSAEMECTPAGIPVSFSIHMEMDMTALLSLFNPAVKAAKEITDMTYTFDFSPVTVQVPADAASYTDVGEIKDDSGFVFDFGDLTPTDGTVLDDGVIMYLPEGVTLVED